MAFGAGCVLAIPLGMKSKLALSHLLALVVLFQITAGAVPICRDFAVADHLVDQQLVTDLINKTDIDSLEADPYAGKKSPLAPKPLLSRVIGNIHRWYFKKDTRMKSDLKKDKDYNFLSDYDYLREKRQADKLGTVRSIFSDEFDTRIYYTANGKPNAKGEIPVVNPEARALYFYFHGSGTNKASGVNFSYKMNRLAALGYSVISIDLPFHADGSRSRKMLNADYFYANLKRMIDKYRVEGMPVYLSGHSFGPEIAAEFFTRYPHSVDGALMISPASFTKELVDWFMNKTAHMTALWGDMVTNDDGASFAGILSDQHRWKLPKNSKNPDPTVLNPRFKLMALTGAYEEYAPGKLDSRGLPTKEKREYEICRALMSLFSGIQCKSEPGVGHYIFEHKDENGHDVIMRDLLALDGQKIENEKQLKAEAQAKSQIPDTLELARRFQREAAFKNYMILKYEGLKTVTEILEQNDLTLARKIAVEFNRHVTGQREQKMVENVINTKDWNPSFYAKYKAEIEAIDMRKPRLSDNLLVRYFELLESLPSVVRSVYAVATPEVYLIPDSKGPPQHVLDRMKKEKEAKELQLRQGTKPADDTQPLVPAA